MTKHKKKLATQKENSGSQDQMATVTGFDLPTEGANLTADNADGGFRQSCIQDDVQDKENPDVKVCRINSKTSKKKGRQMKQKHKKKIPIKSGENLLKSEEIPFAERKTPVDITIKRLPEKEGKETEKCSEINKRVVIPKEIDILLKKDPLFSEYYQTESSINDAENPMTLLKGYIFYLQERTKDKDLIMQDQQKGSRLNKKYISYLQDQVRLKDVFLENQQYIHKMETSELREQFRIHRIKLMNRICELDDKIFKLEDHLKEKRELIDILSKQLKENIILFRHLELNKSNEWNDYIKNEYQDLVRKP